MEQIRDYALWIIPDGKAFSDLKKRIDLISCMYSTPSFIPHITILGRVTGCENALISKGIRLSSIIRPFHISLTTIEYSDEYFRCLFIKSERSKELIDLHKKTKTIFNIKNRKYYMPHMSLMYGNLPFHLKKKIISDMGKGYPEHIAIKSIHLVAASVETDPTTWYNVKEFPLGH
jgi:2'-5' RNA ligase